MLRCGEKANNILPHLSYIVGKVVWRKGIIIIVLNKHVVYFQSMELLQFSLGQQNSLDLCPDLMRSVVRPAPFLFHISQQVLPILESISVENSKLIGGRFHFTLINR